MNQETHKLRLLFVISRFLDGGIDTVLIEYLRYLVKKGDYAVTLAIGVHMGKLEVFVKSIPKEVKVIYLNKPLFLTKFPIQRVQGNISYKKKLFDELILNPIRRYSIGKGLRKLAKENDVVIDFACRYSAFMKGIDKPKIGFYHFSPISEIPQNKRQHVGKRLDRYDSIVTISAAMRKEFLQIYPYLAPKLRVIYNGKDMEALEKRAQGKVPAEVKKPYLLAIERLEESQKDLATLLKAMKILKEDYSFTMPLYILGKGKSEKQLKDMARKWKVEDCVHFVGFTPNPYPWLKECSILVHSAKFEGLPTALIEGLLLDKFIICSDCPTGPREILDNGKAGILVPVGDARSFADAIINLMGDKELQARIKQGIDAHKHVFTFEDTYTQFKNLITELT